MQALHRKAGPFANEGERRVVRHFVERLPPSAVVISNLFLPTHQDTLEIDAVLLTPLGVAVVETKDWRGEVTFDRAGCKVNGETRQDPRPATSLKAKVLHSQVKSWGAATSPMVVFASEATLLHCEDERSVPVLKLDQALDEVAKGRLFSRFRNRRTSLTGSEVEEMAGELLSAHASQHARHLGQYRLLSPVDEREMEFWANETASGERKVRLRRHCIDELASKRERDRQLRAAERGFAALRKLESKRLRSLPIVYACFPDPSDDATVWTAYEGIEGPNLLEAQLSLKEKVRALAYVADALAACHDEGVIHRGLSPQALVLPQGGSVPVLLNFDLARVSGVETVAAGSGALRIRDQTRAAPEVQRNPRAAGVASDIFALGITAVEVLTGTHAESPDDARKLARRIKPRELATALKRMIHDRPSQRFDDMRAVATALRTGGKAR